MLAEVSQLGTVEQGGGGGADQDLAAVAGGGDARALVHVGTDVALVGQQRGAGVQADADLDRTVGQGVGRLAGGGQRTGRGRKGDEEGVALGVDLDSAVGRERVAQEARWVARASA